MAFEKQVKELQNLLLAEQEEAHLIVRVLVFPNGQVYFIEDDDALMEETKSEWQGALTEKQKEKYDGTRVHGGAVKIVMLRSDFDALENPNADT